MITPSSGAILAQGLDNFSCISMMNCECQYTQLLWRRRITHIDPHVFVHLQISKNTFGRIP